MREDKSHTDGVRDADVHLKRSIRAVNPSQNRIPSRFTRDSRQSDRCMSSIQNHPISSKKICMKWDDFGLRSHSRPITSISARIHSEFDCEEDEWLGSTVWSPQLRPRHRPYVVGPPSSVRKELPIIGDLQLPMERTRSKPHRLLSVNQSFFFRGILAAGVLYYLLSIGKYFLMAKGFFINVKIPVEPVRSTAPRTAFRESVKLFCDTFSVHIVSIFLILRLLPLVDQLLSFDLPLFVSNGLCLFLYSLYGLILCILLDAVGTPPRRNPFRILVTVLCGKQAFHVAELTAAKWRKSINLKVPTKEGLLRVLQSRDPIPPITKYVLYSFIFLSFDYFLSSSLALSDRTDPYEILGIIICLKLPVLHILFSILQILTEKEKKKEKEIKYNDEVVKKMEEIKRRITEINKENKGAAKYLEDFIERVDSLKFVGKETKEEKPLVEFDSANIKEYQSGLLEKTNSREESKRPCMTEKVLGSVDSTTRISSTDFDAADNTAHLGWVCQSGPGVSLSGNENRGEASKRECITERILGLEDLQQNSGGRSDNAAKSFGVMTEKENIKKMENKYDNEVVKIMEDITRRNRKKNKESKEAEMAKAKYLEDLMEKADSLKFMGKETKEEKPLVEFDSANIKEYQSGLLEKTNSREESKRPCMTEKVLGSVDSTTRISSTDFDAADNTAQLGGACQSGPAVSLSGNENRGDASKRECITERILGLEDLQQNSGGRRDNAAESFGAIYDPVIHMTHSLALNSFEVLDALPTQKQPNETITLLSLGRLTLEGCVQEEKSQDLPRPMQINGVEQRVTKSPPYLGGFTAQSTSSSRWPISLPDGRHIVVLNPLEQSTKNVAHVARAPSVSLPEKMVRRTLKRKCRIMSVIYASHQKHFGKRCEGTAKSFRAMHICRNRGINWVSTVKRIHKQHGINKWPFCQIRMLLGRQWITESLSSIEDLQQHFACKHKAAVKRLGVKVSIFKSSCRQHRVYWLPCQIIKNEQQALDATSNITHVVKADQGIPTVSCSEMENKRESLKRECGGLSVEDLPKHYVGRHEDAMKGLGDSLAWKSFEVLESLPLGEQSILGHFAQRRTPTRKDCVQRKKSQDLPGSLQMDCSRGLAAQGYSLGGERPDEVLSLSMEEKLVSRLQFLHMSWLARSSRHPLALQSGSEILGHIALSSSEFIATNNGLRPGRQDQGGSSASHPERGRARETNYREDISLEDLEKLRGKNRDDAAKSLGVGVTTFKSICRYHGISDWKKFRVSSSSIEPRPNFGSDRGSSPSIPPWPNLGSDNVFAPADPNGENNPSPTSNTLSTNGQTTTDIEMGGPNSEPIECIPNSIEVPTSQNIGNGSIAEFEDPTTFHDCRDADFHFSDVYNEAAGGSGNFCEQVFESSSSVYPVYSDAAAPSQPVPTTLPTLPHSQIASTQIPGENMESFEDWRNLLAPQKEPFPDGHVSGSVNYTIGSISDLAPSQPMSTTPHTTESPEYLRDASASVVEHCMETNHYGSSNLIDPSCLDLAPSQPIPTIPHMMPTKGQDSTFVKIYATYGEYLIKLHLPLMPGIMEMKQAVSKQLGLGLDSFQVMYKDECGLWILMTHDEEVRELLQLTASENQVSNRLVIKVPNTTG